MAVIAQYGALNYILAFGAFKNHTASFSGSMCHGYIRLYENDALKFESYNPTEILADLANFLNEETVFMCEFQGNRSELVSILGEDGERKLAIKFSIKDENGVYQEKDHLAKMNAGTQLYFCEPQAVELFSLLAQQETSAVA